MKTAALIAAAIVICAAAWVAGASWLYCYLADDPFTLLAWPYALKWWGANWWVTFIIIVSGAFWLVVGFLAVLIAGGFFRRGKPRPLTPPPGGGLKPLETGVTDNLGHARFAGASDMQGRFDGPGTLIGANSRDPRAKMLFDDPERGPGHWLAFAGPGSDKSTSLVHRLWLWDGPRVCFDPSCELGPIMGDALGMKKEDGGQGANVKTIDIRGNGVNILDWIDLTDPECDAHCRTVTNWIYNGGATPTAQQKNPFWITNGKALVTCLLVHVLYSDGPDKTVKTVREGIATPEGQMMDLLRGIHATSRSAYARQLAAGFMDMRANETFSGIYSNATSATEWLSVDAYAEAVSGDAVKTSDVLDSNAAIFVQIPLRTLMTTPTLGKAIMGALFNAVFQDDGRTMKDRALFAIDEAWTLGPSEEVALAHLAGRKYKICCGTIWPSEAKMEEIWERKGAQMLRETSNWRSYNAIQDGEIAERLSADLGSHAVMAYSEGVNEGTSKPRGSWFAWGTKSDGMSTNRHEVKRRLVTRDEAMRAPADVLYVLVRDYPYPLMAFTAPYYRYPAIAGLMQANRFATAAE